MPLFDLDSIPQEPSLPAAEDYREALASGLLEYLSGAKTAEQALAKVTNEWNEITQAAGARQRTNYEKSLGLTL